MGQKMAQNDTTVLVYARPSLTFKELMHAIALPKPSNRRR
jgi:hypothetical protein